MHTRNYTCYEIYNHEKGTITIFENYENVLKWIEDNKVNPNGYSNYGLKLITNAETDIWYTEEKNE